MTPRLKSLELHGYKTFASSTVFEFPGNVTAIVGPNGSGKSNISDAIRWVLGEQAFSLLRGKKTEDMIFTGSELRPRSSMATASIVFNNEDNWLPIDFSEVLITRRAYRDGENEYLLNNQKVRLKEINELLAQTGLAERTYTVIGQGLVDAALSLKPDERRKFFEEAAGIDLYRSRREEAFNRLEATKRNLERVFDILSELTPRMRSLERQAKKVEEFERVRSELRLLLRDWYGYQWHHAQKDLSRTKDNLKVHESQLGQVRAILDESEMKFSGFREQVNAIRKNLDQWHTQIASMHLQREQFSRQLAVFEERLSGLKAKNQEQDVQVGIAEEEISSLQKDFADLHKEKTAIELKLRESEKQSQEVRVHLEERQRVSDGIELNISNKKSQVLKLETQKMSLNARQIDLDNQVKASKREIENRKESLHKIDIETAEIGTQLDDLQVQKRTQLEENSRIDSEIKSRQIDYSQVDKEIDLCRGSLIQFQAETARYNEQLKYLSESSAKFIDSSSGAKDLLIAAKSGKIPANINLLGKDLLISKEYEKAVTAVLGEAFEALVVENESDLASILDFIEKSNSARSFLIQKTQKSNSSLEKLPTYPDILGKLGNLVKPTNVHGGLLHTFLNGYLVAKNRDAAARIYHDLGDFEGVVTLQGELFSRSGMVIAGQGRNDNRISFPRLKMETEELLHKAEAKQKEYSENLIVLEQKKAENRRTLESLQELFAAARDKANSIAARIDHAGLRGEQIKQQTGWLHQQDGIDTVKIEKSQNEIQEISKKLLELNNQIELVKKDVIVLDSQKDSSALQEIQSKAIDFDTQNAVYKQAIKNLEIRAIEKQQAKSGTETRKNDLQVRNRESKREVEELSTNRNSVMDSETRIKKEIEELRIKVDPAELELISKEKEFQEDLLQQENHRQAVTSAERLVAQAQLEFTRQTGHIENLRERIEDDFGLVAFEYANNVSGPTPLPFEGIVEELPIKEELPIDLDESISQLRTHLRRMGPINQEADSEYRTAKERHEFLAQQTDDLTKADADLRQVIANLDDLMRKEFKKTFEAVAVEFHEIFGQLFQGGNARLIMTEGENPNDTGVDIEARLPGRREQGLSLLSGGERSLTAVALIFALLRVSPTPFCVLDEVDAMLDESNVGRFCDMLRELSEKTQFIIITHNRNTVQVADVIYGVTMGKDSASQVISLQMDEISEEMAK